MEKLDWERVRERLERMNGFAGGLRAFFAALHVLGEGFKGKREHCCCIDERIVAEKNIVGKQFEAGCGIRHPVVNVYERARVVADYLVKKGVKIVCPHSDCSAAKAAFKEDYDAGQIVERLEFENTDSYARWFAQEVQNHLNTKIGFDYQINFIETRPQGIHYATGAWFDQTGVFNPEALGKEVPPMFAIDASGREGIGQRYALTQLRMVYRLALLSEHGFGRNFFRARDHRFVISVVATSERHLLEICERVSAFVRDHDSHILPHLNIGGFVVEHQHRRHAEALNWKSELR